MDVLPNLRATQLSLKWKRAVASAFQEHPFQWKPQRQRKPDLMFNVLRFNKKNWKAVMLCVCAAMIFWFFNSLNKQYAANIKFPVRFDFDRTVYMVVSPLPEEVRLNVSGLGWDLFRRSVGFNTEPLKIQLDRPVETRKIVGSVLPVMFSAQMEDLKINFILTDTLYLNIEPRQTKTVVLAVRSVNRYIQKEYAVAGDVKVSPDKAIIIGPQTLIKMLPDTIDLQLNDQNIDQAYDEEINLPEFNALLNPEPKRVQVSFEVEKNVEYEDTLSLKMTNAPRRSRPFMENPVIKVRLKSIERYAGQIDHDSVYALIDLSGVSAGRTKFLPQIIGLPPEVKLVGVDSVAVDFKQ